MFYDQQISESKSIREANDTMPTISEIAPTSVHGSQISPQFPSDNRQMQQYKQAWIIESQPTNEVVSKKSRCDSGKECILAMLGVGVLIGLFICGIPLAVMTTLYLQQKTSSNGSNTGSNGTSSIVSNTLPSQCTSYMSNTDNTRNAAYTCSGCYCDDFGSITAGWYRFSGPAGTQLITTPVSVNRCGASYPGWFNVTLPSIAGSTTSGIVCANYAGNLCYALYSVNSILATNCNGFYVFYLTPMPFCNSRFCTT